MKTLVVLYIALVTSSQVLACDQKTYDKLYVKIVQQALQDSDMDMRNHLIRTLRQLCEGQLSTYETKWRGKYVQNHSTKR